MKNLPRHILSLALAIVANVALIGAAYAQTVPSYVEGASGVTRSGIGVSVISGTTAVGVTSMASDGATSTVSPLNVANYPFLYGGSNVFNRWYAASAVPNNGGGTAGAVALIPTSAANAAITPIVSSAAESNHVLKGSLGNLFRIRVTATVGGYLMVFNATTAPADGAVTPQLCQSVAANTTVEIDHPIPDRYSTGITAVYSSTGCFTKTASATALIEGYVE